MFRLLRFIVNTFLWLQVFIVPAALFGFAAFLLYKHSKANLPWALLLGGAGFVGGIWLAERIRRRRGLLRTFGRLRSTPELYTEEERSEL
jgi:FtsH-binding integral membrane protein